MEKPPQRRPKRPLAQATSTLGTIEYGSESGSNIGSAEMGARLDIILKRLVKDNKMRADDAKRLMEYVFPEKSEDAHQQKQTRETGLAFASSDTENGSALSDMNTTPSNKKTFSSSD